MKNIADKSVNKLYGGIRSQYNDARANGYRLHAYFLREQEILMSTFNEAPGTVLDIGCGSGLMSLPILDKAKLLIGLDFNAEACNAAKINLLNIIRGNAFSMPLNSESIDNAYCCQFLNQQSHGDMKLLLAECHRIIIPNGNMVLIWRNGDALIHKFAHTLFKLSDWLTGRPSFPMVNHSMLSVENHANSIGFETIEKEVIFPLLRWRSNKITSLVSKFIGASYFIVLKRS